MAGWHDSSTKGCAKCSSGATPTNFFLGIFLTLFFLGGALYLITRYRDELEIAVQKLATRLDVALFTPEQYNGGKTGGLRDTRQRRMSFNLNKAAMNKIVPIFRVKSKITIGFLQIVSQV